MIRNDKQRKAMFANMNNGGSTRASSCVPHTTSTYSRIHSIDNNLAMLEKEYASLENREKYLSGRRNTQALENEYYELRFSKWAVAKRYKDLVRERNTLIDAKNKKS